MTKIVDLTNEHYLNMDHIVSVKRIHSGRIDISTSDSAKYIVAIKVEKPSLEEKERNTLNKERNTPNIVLCFVQESEFTRIESEIISYLGI